MYLTIPDIDKYNDAKIYGIWNKWTNPINSDNFDFIINGYKFYYIDYYKKELLYKIKIGDNYELIDNYLINYDEFYNNKIVFMADNKYFNGIITINEENGKIIVYKNNILIFDCKKKFNLPIGLCTLYNDNGIIKYSGEYSINGENGYGISFNRHGKKEYEGFLKNGLKFGKGTLFDGFGNKLYEGNFINGLSHGKGILYKSNTKIHYEGEFSNSLFHGVGKLFNDNNNIEYCGSFSNELKNGNGILYSKCCNVIHDGKFKNNKKYISRKISFIDTSSTDYSINDSSNDKSSFESSIEEEL